MSAREMSVLMGFDAMRICMGLPPKHFTEAEVSRWMTLMRSDKAGEGHG